jgi:hypothetical protein
MDNTVELIRAEHRYRWQAIKMQAKLDRGLEAFVRINATDWHPTDDETVRDKYNREVAKIITAAHKGQGMPAVIKLVAAVDRGREPFDELRTAAEKRMETLAKDLPAAPWVAGVRGVGMLGFATIVAVAGDLSNYPNPAKLWKRLGFAPYQGLAGSTWKRETWRPRALTSEEWIANPFSGSRYALMHQIAIWLVNAQWTAAGKDPEGAGKPKGPYGEVYAKRREHTAREHPDWTKGHGRMDGVRIAMKAFLKDLHLAWRERAEVREAAE